MHKRTLYGLALCAIAACSSNQNNNGNNGPNGPNGPNNPSGQNPNGEIPSEVKYQVTEASGEFRLEFARNHNGATSMSTSIVRMRKGDQPNILGQDALYLPDAGLLQINPALHYTTLPINGTETRGTTTTPCRGPRVTEEFEDIAGGRFGVNFDRYFPRIPTSPPAGFAFVAFHRGRYPTACNDVKYDLQVDDLIERSRRTQPISVAQLLAGRFVLESTGSSPIRSPKDDEGGEHAGVSGTLHWTYRIVFQSGTYNPQAQPAPPVAEIDDSGDVCASGEDVFTADSLEVADGAQAAGQSLYPVTPNKCVRVRRVAEGGTKKIVEVLTTLGTKFTFDERIKKLIGSPDERLVERWTEEPRRIGREIDANLDGPFDALVEHRYNEGGQLVSSERTDKDPLTGENRLRSLATPIDAARVQVVHEAFENGQWVPFEQFEAPRMQLRCFRPQPPGPGGGTCNATYMPCSAAEKRLIRQRMSQARDRIAKNCGKKHAGVQAQANEVFGLVEANKVNFACTSAACADFGGFDPDPRPDGTYDMQINITKFRASERSAQATLYHELLHSQIRHHTDMEKLAGSAEKLPVVDAVFACENLCFSDVVTLCDCNRCMAKKARTPSAEHCNECSQYRECPVKRDAQGNAISSEVAAFCPRGSGILCDTQNECDAECLSTCQSYKASCRPNCN